MFKPKLCSVLRAAVTNCAMITCDRPTFLVVCSLDRSPGHMLSLDLSNQKNMRRLSLHGLLLSFLKDLLRMKIRTAVLRRRQKPRLPSSNFDFKISRQFCSRHLACTFTFTGRLWKICMLFTIEFLAYKNDHTCLPVVCFFFKFPRHLTHPC